MGRVFGWGMFAFLGGIALQTATRFYIPPSFWIAALIVLAVLALIPNPRVRIAVFLLAASLFGVWRTTTAPKPHLRVIDGRAFITRSASVDVWAAQRSWVTARIRPYFSDDGTALVAGILYGDADFSKEAREHFVSSGLMHIVAVSGSNVTILIHAVSVLLVGIGLRRRHAFYVSTFALIGFTLFVGAGASVLRASVMAWFLLLAREVGRPTSAFRLLLVSAVILTFQNPWTLLYDASFALSFLAMWGVLAWTPVFLARFTFLPTRFGLREIASMTSAATLMTTPYVAWAFGRLSLAGLFTNLVALPLVPFIMVGGFCIAIVSGGVLSPLVAIPTEGFVRALYLISRLGDVAPWLDFHVRGIHAGFCIAAYIFIVYLWTTISVPEEEACGLFAAMFGHVSRR